MRKIAFIENTWNNTKDGKYSGVGYYRLVLPAKYIKKYQIDIIGKEIKDWGDDLATVFGKLFREYDAVVTKAVDNPQAASALCFCAQHFKKTLIVDLDDNYFEVRPDQPGYRFYYPGSQKQAILKAYLSLATHLTVSTKPLADWYGNWFKKNNIKTKIDILPNFNDLEEFNYDYNGNRSDKSVVIGWQGSTTHFGDLKMVLPALKKVIHKYDNVAIELTGGLEMTQARDLFKDWTKKEFKRVTISGGTPSWKDYPEMLSKKSWDIGICPLIDDEFNRNKSNIKWMEYAVYKIPCVASKVYPYYKKVLNKNTINDGINGFLASSTDEWYKKLSKLIEDKQLRIDIGNKAYNEIKNNWQMKDNSHLWEEVFDRLLK